MTVGAAGALNDILKALLNPGEEILTPSPYFVGLVSYTASLGVAMANNVRRRTPLRGLLSKRDSVWFVVTGVLYGSAVFVLNVALQYGDLSVVGPIVSCEPIFVMLLGLAFFGERNLRPALIACVVTVVIGVVLISL